MGVAADRPRAGRREREVDRGDYSRRRSKVDAARERAVDNRRSHRARRCSLGEGTRRARWQGATPGERGRHDARGRDRRPPGMGDPPRARAPRPRRRGEGADPRPGPGADAVHGGPRRADRGRRHARRDRGRPTDRTVADAVDLPSPRVAHATAKPTPRAPRRPVGPRHVTRPRRRTVRRGVDRHDRRARDARRRRGRGHGPPRARRRDRRHPPTGAGDRGRATPRARDDDGRRSPARSAAPSRALAPPPRPRRGRRGPHAPEGPGRR